MRIVTFYSYKGGVGRTLACANFGLYLAKTGQKVVLADMDFEAPGLDSKFPAIDVAEIQGGMLEQFDAFQKGRPVPHITAAEIPLPEDVVQTGGSLRLIPAGNYKSKDYYAKLSGLQWDFFLVEKTGLAFCIELIKTIEESFGADVLLIDSRTGLTEIGGLCTQVFPDTVVLLTCTSKESLAGTQRIYKRISNSPIVKSRGGGRTQVDLRIIVARTPRPEDLPAFDKAMKERVDIPIERLYYLFDQRDMSVEEYLALDRFAEEHPAILDDYVELFASLNPEITFPYIQERLDAFRSGVTRRSAHDNERLIQELLTLFPGPEVMLEAARYYRIAKEGDAEAVRNYLRYLEHRKDDRTALAEFAEVCGNVPENQLKPKDKVVTWLKVFGVEHMDAVLLSRYSRMSKSKEIWGDIIKVIEGDEAKMQLFPYRQTYFGALRALGEWQRIIQGVGEKDLESREIVRIAAEAHADLGDSAQALRIIRKIDIDDHDELLFALSIVYKVMPGADFNSTMEAIQGFDSRFYRSRGGDMFQYLTRRYRMSRPREFIDSEPGFMEWLDNLRKEEKRRD